MSEIWKVVPNHIDYKISNKGNLIKRAYKKIYEDGVEISYDEERVEYRMADRFLTAYIDSEVVYIHRLVAELFVENPNDCRYVIHKDGNRINNSSDNLMWSAGSVKNVVRQTQKVGYPILCITTGDKYKSIRHCSNETGLDYYKLRNAILSGKDIQGLTFRFD